MSNAEIANVLAGLKAKLEAREHKNALARDRRRTAKLTKLGVVVKATTLRVVR